jgi:hypothetical protein
MILQIADGYADVDAAGGLFAVDLSLPLAVRGW